MNVGRILGKKEQRENAMTMHENENAFGEPLDVISTVPDETPEISEESTSDTSEEPLTYIAYAFSAEGVEEVISETSESDGGLAAALLDAQASPLSVRGYKVQDSTGFVHYCQSGAQRAVQ